MAIDSTERQVDAFGQTNASEVIPQKSEDSSKESMVGHKIGSYIVLRKLGQGGMGVVYEAVHESIGQRTAIKVLHARLSQDSKISERFLNEARATSIVRHPGLVKVYDHQRLPDGSVCLIMEFLEGESLESCLQRLRSAASRIPPARAVEIMRQAASALQAAHGAGIVHCDLKPDNIFLVPDPAIPGGERVKLLDFGIAKFLSNSVSHTTTMDVIMGTPRYMSPEQCLGREGVDGKVDVYALGVILYELLAGQRPFEAQSPQALMRQHLNMTPPPLRERAPGINDRLCKLVHVMLAKEGISRPTMATVLEQLGSFPQLGQRRRLRHSALVVFAVMLATLVGIGGWLYLRKAPPEKRPIAAVPAAVPEVALPAVAPAPSINQEAPTPAAAASAEPPTVAPPAPTKHRVHRTPVKRSESSHNAPASGVLKSVSFGKD